MLSTTPRTTLGRSKERGSTDRTDLYDVLDTGLICHLGVVVNGHPMVVPTGYGRIGDTLYLHGSTGAASLRAGGGGADVCVTVTHLDGIVLARSIFHHSVNYRSAMIYGTARLVTDPDERMAGLRALAEQLAPGQWDYVRRPSRKELAATAVLALSLEEASVKIRRGAPKDEEEDYDLPVWAGVLPLVTSWGTPEPDSVLPEGIEAPVHILHRE
ncbi:nitroimidazol reductase NimA-like FMN-containing flavoprotein (pyridoxamine 5'-phosphate oxidase superfamily) [Nonomuraea thailandensis]|uniref:Nitroimidazol reductase NimA-like FMN-containing flavoprotein (Pyridoxamine 5'-phosphate oxidase superfamily) n=1 Tax=Nonomuraea thailandensis TaxID=1188745 RepID=A0A9X2GWG5_9ACTN|nr:pyridoxamine 5'-phosphate oxidase family protein [Nonomuraea thailandensis]MCP2365205.1 nitroimidazol reductase NimA-like FMN-containing flavoprotein (pyridoxamine 5'-phosphate oxidase superfamily) [Nonomuraea thailandensis]